MPKKKIKKTRLRRWWSIENYWQARVDSIFFQSRYFVMDYTLADMNTHRKSEFIITPYGYC